MNFHWHSLTLNLNRTFRRLPIALLMVFIVIILSSPPVEAQSTLVCDPQLYHGVQHCKDTDDTHLILVDLNNPYVRVQTVLPVNPQTDEECNSVNAKDHPSPFSRDTSSNCNYLYPREPVKVMLQRYVDGFRESGFYTDFEPVAIINTDYFGTDGDHGAQGLAVRNGLRLDGLAHNDNDAGALLGSTQPSLAISQSNVAVIGVPGTESEINNNLADKYFNSVGGAPVVVRNGIATNANCTYPYPGDKCSQLSQSAAGITNDGRLILISSKSSAGQLATYLINNHRVQSALKFDGGGSVSMAWVNNTGGVEDFCSQPNNNGTCRAVAEGLLIFSQKIQETNTVDVALIIDSSGSMTSNDRDNKRLVAARAYLSASLSGDFVGVVDFDGSARLASPLLELPQNKTTLVNAINTIDSFGSTNIGVGVQAGCDALINSLSANTIKAAILITDGEGSFNHQDFCFRDRGWPIYTFGFGTASDLLLQEIATTTGGEFARLPTSDFVCEFLRVRSKIAGVEPGSCSTLHIGPLEISIFVINVPPGQQQVSFSTSWTGSDIEMSLISPSGRVIDRNTIAPDVVHDLGPTFEVYTILNPEPGDWEVTLFGADVPASGEEVVFGFTSIPSSLGPIFTDVPDTHWAWDYIERLYSAGITSGCGTSPLTYCPEGSVTRAQMAVFLLRGRYGSTYNPPPVGASTGFSDVPANHWAGAWIKQLAADGITVGCGSGNYCPESPVTRAQMAVFLLRSKYGASYNPPAVGTSTGFSDVPATHWASAWIKQLVTEGITAGCGSGNYCPESPVTRAQMAVFLVRTFSLP